jgi:hypothetical protein
MSNRQDEVKAYDQLCTSYRAIDDFRAKLLGFLPLATGTGIFLLVDRLQNPQDIQVETKGLLAAVGLFGALITLGLFSYEIYGITKCAALINAGKQIEILLHLDNGQFTRRPQNVAYVINEPFAAGIIYPTVLAAWTFFTLAFAWPEANPWFPIFVLVIGFVGTLLYDDHLRKTYEQAAQTMEGNTQRKGPS